MAQSVTGILEAALGGFLHGDLGAPRARSRMGPVKGGSHPRGRQDSGVIGETA